MKIVNYNIRSIKNAPNKLRHPNKILSKLRNLNNAR